jgi:Ca-activated chloride channel family protein
MMTFPESFHFLRPEWFWALLPLLLLVVLMARRRIQGGSWLSVVDPALLPHLLIEGGVRKRSWPLPLLTLAGVLTISALAGPVWHKLEQPVFRQESSLVVLLDLSSSMDAGDTKPSRLARAKLKIKDILERRNEGETALVTYAADAFVVTPLTTDTHTIASQLSGMSTGLMPAQGSRPDLALKKGLALLHQAGKVTGSLLLVSDGIDGAPPAQLQEQIRQLAAGGYQLLVLGVGSEEGAPIPLPDGGFMKDQAGNIVLAARHTAQMEQAAHSGGGLYRSLVADESDIDALLAAVDGGGSMGSGKAINGQTSDEWQEEGPWLLLPVLLISLFAFRRGVLLLAVVLVLPVPREGMAAGLDTLWLNRDQQAQQALQQGESKRAAELFADPAWRAAARYKSGDYQQAADELAGIEGAEASYNRGNALAQMGKLEEALKAYEEALQRQPGMADAAFNRDRVTEWLKEAEQQGEPGESGENGENGESSKEQGESQEQQEGSGSEPSQSSEEKGDSTPSEAGGEQQQQGEEPASPAEEKSAEEQAAGQQLADKLAEEGEAERPEEHTAAMPSETTPTPNPEERELQQATEQWLRRIPDDPSGLWRRKFLYQYKNQQQPTGEEERPW